MKKLLCVLISVLCISVCAFFISCNKETDTDQTQNEQTDNNGSDDQKSDESTDGGTDKKDESSDTTDGDTTGGDTAGGDTTDGDSDEDDSDDSDWDTKGANFSQMSAKEKYDYIFNGSFNANIKVTDVYDGDVYTRANEYTAQLSGKRVYATRTEKGDEDEGEEDTTIENFLFSIKKGKNIASFVKRVQTYNMSSGGTQTQTNIYCKWQNQIITLDDLLSVMTYGGFNFKSEYLSKANTITLTTDPDNENILTYTLTIPEKPTDESTNEEKEAFYNNYCNNYVITSIKADFSTDNPRITIAYSHIVANGYWSSTEEDTYVLKFQAIQSQSTYVSTIEMTFSDVGNVKTIDYPESTQNYNSLYDNGIVYMYSLIEDSEEKQCMTDAIFAELPEGIITIPESITVGNDKCYVRSATFPEIPSGKEISIIMPECAYYGCRVKTNKDSTATGKINAYYLGTEYDDDDYFGGYEYGTLYFYSETEPTKDGNYWHYDTDGKTPIVWDAISGVTFEEVNGTIYVMTVKDTTAKAVYIPLKNGDNAVGGVSNGIFLQSSSLTKIYFEGTLEQWNTLTNDVESLGL